EVIPPSQAADLGPGAAAGVEVAMLLAGDDQDQIGLWPIAKQPFLAFLVFCTRFGRRPALEATGSKGDGGAGRDTNGQKLRPSRHDLRSIVSAVILHTGAPESSIPHLSHDRDPDAPRLLLRHTCVQNLEDYAARLIIRSVGVRKTAKEARVGIVRHVHGPGLASRIAAYRRRFAVLAVRRFYAEEIGGSLFIKHKPDLRIIGF